MERSRGLGIIVFLLCLVLPTARATPLHLEEAQARAQKESKWLLVRIEGRPDSRASSSWSDPKVTQWLQERAVVVELKEQAVRGLAKEWKVRRFPTALLFRDGREFDRLGGNPSPAALLSWLEGSENGETRVAHLRREWLLGQVVNRYRLAQALLDQGDYSRAVPHYLWLWENTSETPYETLRVVSILEDIGYLCRHSPEADEAFAKLREENLLALRSRRTARLAQDWVTLERRLGDPENVLQWYRLQPQGLPHLAAVRPEIFEILYKQRRWEEAGRVFPDPVARARQLIESWNQLDSSAELGAGFAVLHLAPLREALLAAGREEDARALSELVLQHYRTPRTLRVFR